MAWETTLHKARPKIARQHSLSEGKVEVLPYWVHLSNLRSPQVGVGIHLVLGHTNAIGSVQEHQTVILSGVICDRLTDLK